MQTLRLHAVAEASSGEPHFVVYENGTIALMIGPSPAYTNLRYGRRMKSKLPQAARVIAEGTVLPDGIRVTSRDASLIDRIKGFLKAEEQQTQIDRLREATDRIAKENFSDVQF